MATVKRTSPTSLQVIKPDCLVATLYTGATTETADNPAGDTFIFDEVVRDTTTISQDDNDSTTIENEFSDDPILDIVSLGKFQFAAEVADIQTEILKTSQTTHTIRPPRSCSLRLRTKRRM